MIPTARYAELEQALAEKGAQLLTGAAEYQRAHVPQAVLAELARPLGSGPAVVKDFVKSRKHEWHEACYVPDAEDPAGLHALVSTFVERQGDDLAGGIVIRAFERFVPNGPDAGQARVWWLDGRPVLIGPHPDSPQVAPQPELAEIGPLVTTLGCRFITTDLARHTDGRWRVVRISQNH